MPYWTSPDAGGGARWKLAGVVGLTLGTTGVSVVFNFLGRDFFNALSEKNADQFLTQIYWYLGAFVIGIPVFVFKSYYQSKLALEWREWMTSNTLKQYFEDRTFYSLQGTSSSDGVVDNPDQRISSDISKFTDTALGLALTLLNAAIDLVSFSGILFSIYPPLFGALLVYSIGGTVGSIYLGKNLVTLNFNQEAREADFRYNLVRVRENAESVAFFKGEDDERAMLTTRLKSVVANYTDLILASRNLDFFTSFYRFLIQLLPAVVVAPLYFQGKIDFGVINQSTSAFNHILADMSLVVYQFESLAGFSAVIDRLGQFTEVMDQHKGSAAGAEAAGAALPPAGGTTAAPALAGTPTNGAHDTASISASDSDGETSDGSSAQRGAPDRVIALRYDGPAAAAAAGSSAGSSSCPLMSLEDLTVCTPDGGTMLVQDLTMEVAPGQSTLIMGPSGAGKTSIMRAVAGLWRCGSGAVRMHCDEDDVMFLPQRPYMVLGSLRDQVLYPRVARPGASLDSIDSSDEARATADGGATSSTSSNGAHGAAAAANGAHGAAAASNGAAAAAAAVPGAGVPSDASILGVLESVQLGRVLERLAMKGSGLVSALDVVTDWASVLSLGEQQRLAWARLLVARPRLALLDEATSALDGATERSLYTALASSGITYVSIGHRDSLRSHHARLLTIQPGSTDGAQGPSWSVAATTESAVSQR